MNYEDIYKLHMQLLSIYEMRTIQGLISSKLTTIKNSYSCTLRITYNGFSY